MYLVYDQDRELVFARLLLFQEIMKHLHQIVSRWLVAIVAKDLVFLINIFNFVICFVS